MTDLNPHIIPVVDGNCFICDNSTLEIGSTCPRAFQFYKLNKRERTAERAALKFGGAIHEALEIRYRACMDEGAVQFTDDLLDRCVEKLRSCFTNWTPAPEEWRTFDVAVGALKRYQTLYPIEDSQILAVERPFLKPLGSIVLVNVWTQNHTMVGGVLTPEGKPVFHAAITLTILWSGRLDLIKKREDRIYFTDHKTTSMMGPTYFKEFDLASQFHGYSWAIEQELGHLPYACEVNALGIRKPTRTGVPYEFERKPILIYRELVTEWANDTLTILTTLLSYASNEFFPKHTKHCQGKYGECQYKNICISPDQASRDLLLSTGEYSDVTWSPLNDR